MNYGSQARTDSTGRPCDPDFIFFKFLKNAKMHSDSQKYRFTKVHTIFAKIKNVVANQKQILTNRYCRMPGVI